MGRMPVGLEAFYTAEYPRLVRALDAYCGDLGLAQELAHEALVRACERWEKVSAMDSPGGWVHRVAINAANSTFRRRRAERRALARPAAQPPTADDPPDTEMGALIRDAITGLPAHERPWVRSRAPGQPLLRGPPGSVGS